MFLLATLQTLTNTKIVPHPIYVPAILPSHCLIFSIVYIHVWFSEQFSRSQEVFVTLLE
jgi:hypothetical protein